jgi:hypothetical protein
MATDTNPPNQEVDVHTDSDTSHNQPTTPLVPPQLTELWLGLSPAAHKALIRIGVQPNQTLMYRNRDALAYAELERAYLVIATRSEANGRQWTLNQAGLDLLLSLPEEVSPLIARIRTLHQT